VPLKKGKSKETVAKNIGEMMKHGYPQKVAVAASLSQARKSGVEPATPVKRAASRSR